MKIEDIKIGETYDVRVTVIDIDEDQWLKLRTSELGLSFILNPKEVTAFTPLPKYDPNRLFREGDEVRVKREVHGRPVYIGEDAWGPLDPNEIWEVVEEKETGWVHLKNGCRSADVWHGMLELVTPVEELEPYYLTESSDFWGVDKDDLEVEAAVFWKKTHPNAKVAAEDECVRLNAEWRKKISND